MMRTQELLTVLSRSVHKRIPLVINDFVRPYFTAMVQLDAAASSLFHQWAGYIGYTSCFVFDKGKRKFCVGKVAIGITSISLRGS